MRLSAAAKIRGGDGMPDLDKDYLSEFEDILDLPIKELLQKAIEENWKVKYVEFWIKVKNARNFERLVAAIEAL